MGVWHEASVTAPRRGSLPGLLLLYATLFGAYGTESPFLPSFLGERGLTSGEIGVVLAAGTLTRLAAGPIAGRLADRHDATRLVLGGAAALSGLVSLAYLAGHGFWPLLAIGMAHAVAIASLAPLADALALAAAERERTFSYGWIRGAGSGAFILGTLASGQLVASAGLSSILVSSGVLFLVMALATTRVPAPSAPRPAEHDATAFWAPLAIPAFRRLVLVAAIVMGSHALNDGFAVILWREAGIPDRTIGWLWSESVAAEVVVFVLIGPWLLDRLGPARAAGLAAGIGVLRWSVMAVTTSVPVLAVSQLTHGFTFALLHLAAMSLIGRLVPERSAATAQTLYGTLGLGIASAALTLVSGSLYARFGAGAFWAMAALCAAAIPAALTLSVHADGVAPPSGSSAPG